MQKARLKFPVQKNKEFIDELRASVSEYFKENNISKYGNLNLYAKTIIMLGIYLVPLVMMLTGVITSFWIALLAWVIMGIGKAGVGMGVMHDANHQSYSGNRLVNKWLSKTMYLLGGFPLNWQYQHNVMHHGFTNIDGHDEDIDPGSVMRLSPHKPRLKIHRFQHIYGWFLYGLSTISWVTTKDFEQLKRYRDENVKLNTNLSYPQLFFILALSKVLYYTVFMVLPMILMPFAWYWIPVFFFAMHFTSGLVLTSVFQTAHVVPATEFPQPDKNGSMENSWAIHQLYTTSNFAPGNRLLGWFIGGLNYQVEHHLFPNISHVHYPEIASIVKETAKKYNLPYYVQPGFFSAVREHGRMLRKLGNSN